MGCAVETMAKQDDDDATTAAATTTSPGICPFAQPQASTRETLLASPVAKQQADARSEEAAAAPVLPGPKEAPPAAVPLRVVDGKFVGSAATAALLREVGGSEAILHLTDRFYQKMFKDPHLDQFVGSHEEPHPSRLANWIVEKMGGEGNVWTAERQQRIVDEPKLLAGGRSVVVHDRSSAHAAAWWSPKREPDSWGRRFTVADSRNWMRLMFWSAREEGLFERSPRFAEWYVRFIGHFVRVYERQAPMFARESARWSEDRRNIDRYLAAGLRMEDVHRVSEARALTELPESERRTAWPYEQRS